MLKEVGASGQISLGKKYAGQLFDLQTQPDGTIVLQPMQLVPTTVPQVQEERARYASTPDAPGAPDASAIAQYNDWAAQRQPYAQRVRQWREGQNQGQK